MDLSSSPTKAEPSDSSLALANESLSSSKMDEILRIINNTALKPPKNRKEPQPTRFQLIEIPPLDIPELPSILTKRPLNGPHPPLLYYGYPSPPNYLELMLELYHTVQESAVFTKEEFNVVYVKNNRCWIVDEKALPRFIELFGNGERPKWYLSYKQPRWKWPSPQYRVKAANTKEQDKGRQVSE